MGGACIAPPFFYYDSRCGGGGISGSPSHWGFTHQVCSSSHLQFRFGSFAHLPYDAYEGTVDGVVAQLVPVAVKAILNFHQSFLGERQEGEAVSEVPPLALGSVKGKKKENTRILPQNVLEWQTGHKSIQNASKCNVTQHKHPK